MISRAKSPILLATMLIAAAATPALAHHAMGGETPNTMMQGLLSGLAHPVIGLDHFAAIIGVGILAALVSASPAVVFAFIAAMIGGVGIHLASIDLPSAELLVALSTAAIGVLVAIYYGLKTIPAALIFALAGIAHGYALGESIVGAEPTPLAAYLAGLFIVQSAIALGAYFATKALLARGNTAEVPVAIRGAGLAIAALGSYFAAGAAGLIA